MNEIKFNPTVGTGDKKVSVLSGINEGLDASVNYSVTDIDKKIERNVNVTQVGRREKYLPVDSGVNEDMILPDGGTYNVLKPGASGSAAVWAKEQLPPEVTEELGDKSLLPSWDFYLIDMTQGTGDKVRPVGKLRKNNLLRFENGDFAPTVGITEEMRAECDVELYLDNSHRDKYCDAGSFNAVDFYDKYGVSQKLYNTAGAEVRVLRPWETTSKNYSIFAGFNKGVYVVDKVEGKSGKIWSGIYTEDAVPILDGIDLREACPLLPPTGFSPSPICTIGNKSRCFFYLYQGESNCMSGNGVSNTCTMFRNGRTYPRCNDVNQINLAKYCRANNSDPESPYPFAEGGYLTLNAYILYLEMLYGTKYLHNTAFFGSGISSNSAVRNEDDLLAYGGAKYRKKGDTGWLYGSWTAYPSIMHYTAGKTTFLSNWVNFEYPKEQCMESQMAASYANEIGIQEGEEFDFYGSKYWYKNVPGAKSMEEGDMNVKVYKEMTGVISALDENDASCEFDVVCVLRMSLFGGMNLSGDIFRYCGGGHEMVGTCVNDPNVSRVGNPIDIYIEPDQKKWVYEKTYNIKEDQTFGFESLYKKVGRFINTSGAYAISRFPYSSCRQKSGGGLNTGECYYNWESNYWASAIGQRVRVGCRFGGYATYGICSPRNLHANNSAAASYRLFCGFAQMCLDFSPMQ